MNQSRPLSLGELIAGGCGVLLFICLLLPWFGQGGVSLSGWETFNIVDIVIAVLALGVAALAAAAFTGATPRLPFERLALMRVLGIVALVLVLTFAIEIGSGFGPGSGPSIKIGAILAILASIGIIAGVYLAEHPNLIGSSATSGSVGPGAGGAQQPGGYGQQPGGYGQQQPGYEQQAVPAGAAATPPATQQQPAAAPQGSPAPPDRPGQPADWYPDPQGIKRLRYWDGSQWTEHVAD